MQKSQSRTGILILSVLFLLATAGLLYIYFAKQKLPGANAKSSSLLDMRPLIIGRLQQMIAEGSDSLYRLNIEELKPDIFASKISAYKMSLLPDSTVLNKLDKEKRAPDDVLFITLDTLRITGISILDFLHKKDIHLDSIVALSPLVRVAHTNRPYNAKERKQKDSLSLYQKLMQDMNSITIGAVAANNGTFISTDIKQPGKTTTLRSLDIALKEIQIDSTRQYDSSRFLFAKDASFSTRNYVYRTSDSLYIDKVGSVSVSINDKLLVAKDLSMEPRGGREVFEKKLKTRDDMFTVRFSEIRAKNLDWWAVLKGEGLFADEVILGPGAIKDFFDRSLPRSGVVGSKNNFPQQALKEIPFPILIQQLIIEKLDVSYEELNPTIMKSGTVAFNSIKGTVSNITNVAARMKTHPLMTCSAEALFMNKTRLQATFQFNFAKMRTGGFSTQFHLGSTPNTLINPVTEPMGMYTLADGTVDETTVSVTGDNYNAVTDITMLYHDLRMFPLKKTDSSGDMKKQKFLGFIANTFLVKDANPSGKGAPRHYTVPVQRDADGGTFFNFLWKCIMTGIVKTVGLPMRFVDV